MFNSCWTFTPYLLGRVITTTVVLILVGTQYCLSQPDWVSGIGKSSRYLEALYLTGYGLAQKDNSQGQDEGSDRALSTARRNLAEKVRITLQNIVISRQEEINQTLTQYFSATTQAVSGLEIEGLQSEAYYDVAQGVWYALAYVRRDVLAKSYSRKIEGLRAKVGELLRTGTKYDFDGDREMALKALTSCYPLLRELEQSESVLFAVSSEFGGTLARLKADSDRDRMTAQSVETAIAGILKKPVKSIDDAAYLIAFLLKEQLNQKVETIRVEPLTYQESRAASSFSRHFRQVMQGQLTQGAGWKVEPQDGLVLSVPSNALVVEGTYWDQSDGLKLLVLVHRAMQGEVVAGVNTVIPLAVIRKSGLRTKPENLKFARADQKEFFNKDLPPVGLSLEVWTNKGSANPLFARGDKMSVYVRLNIPAYVRFVYHLADGRRALLLDNHYLADKEVNQAYRIPHEFECTAPFGVEVLQVFARTEPFDNVVTKSIDGYDLLTSDLGKFLAVTRGMKIVKSSVMQAERRIVLTTISK